MRPKMHGLDVSRVACIAIAVRLFDTMLSYERRRDFALLLSRVAVDCVDRPV